MLSKVRLALISFFLTFVLVQSAQSAPESTLRPPEIDTRPLGPYANQGSSLFAYRKNSKKTVALSAGSMAGTLVDANEVRSSSFLGITQTNYNSDRTAQNYGVELLQNGQVGAHLGFRTSLVWGEWFEPYYQYGIGSLLKASEGPASLINFQRYQARLHAGFEDFLDWDRNLRLDFGLAFSPLGPSYQFSVFYVFAD
jgi:hypothetical protein